MIKVISIGTDRKVFEERSAVRNRLLKQRELFEELHVIVFSTIKHGLKAEQLGNLWLYPTNSYSRWLYISDSVNLAKALISQREMKASNSVITAQDPFECGLAAYFSAKKRGLPFQLQVHTDLFSPWFKKGLLNCIRLRIAKFILPKAAAVRTVNARIADSLREKGIARVDILPVFSDIAQKWLSTPLKRFKKKDSRLLLLLPARLSLEKNISLALHAMKSIKESGIDLGLFIIGEGKEEKKIREEIISKGLEDTVQIEKWQRDLSSSYRVCDIILLTSLYEGYGLILLEAAVHGRPVISTDVGIARELIKAPYERFVCPVGDSECISERIKELCKDEKLRNAYGLSLRKTAKKIVLPEDEYWKIFRQQLENCIKDDA